MLILLPFFCYFLAVGISKPTAKKGHTSLFQRTLYPPVNLWELSGQYQGDIKQSDGISVRNVQRTGHWPNGIVPYTIVKEQFTEEGIANIEAAMRTIEGVLSSRGFNDGSCQIKFVPHTEQDTDYVEIMQEGKGKCWSYMGVAKIGKQQLSLGDGCWQGMGTILHELGHALGLAHQHESHNRDDYVKIIDENIEPNMSYAFAKKSYENYTDFGLPYDFKSIMHYEPFAFAKQENGTAVGPTIVALNANITITGNSELSELDKLKLQLIYCKDHTSSQYNTGAQYNNTD